MRIQKGDTVFGPNGRPGIVQGRDSESGMLIVENQGPEYNAARRLGFVNGMRPAERDLFKKVMTDVKATENYAERIEMITVAMEELSRDPANIQLVRYLESEKAHLMFSSGITPKTYRVDEAKL
jgi:hypothetical protein